MWEEGIAAKANTGASLFNIVELKLPPALGGSERLAAGVYRHAVRE